jgi:TonB-linked SusC/RagA family outer membrane protein
MKKIAIFLSILLFMGNMVANAQTKTITGTVTSAEDEMPIPGVSVSVKGTTLGTVTNIDGEYELKVPQDAKALLFSFVGMKTEEVAVEGLTSVNVAMKAQSIGVDEVVVSALGISREKKSLGSAVQAVSGEALQQAGSPDVINSLSGKVAGVQINQAGGQLGSSSRIVIRGNSSFGDNQPLIVVDGIPISNASITDGDIDFGSGLNDVNPQDIENISILKGGAAAALYGMRAGNGVVLITTKSGKGSAKGISVTYDGGYNFDQVYGIQDLQNKYGQGSYGSEYNYKYYGEAWDESGSYQEFAQGDWHPGIGFNYVDGLGNGVNDGTDESWGPRLDIGLNLPQFNSPVDGNGVRSATPWVSNPDNVKNFFDIGHTTSHNIALTSVTDKSSTRLSLGFRDQAGTMPNTDLKRYNAGVNSKMTLNDYVNFDIAINYARTESDNLPITGYNASNPLQSFGQWFGRQVDMGDLEANWQSTMENGMPYNWNSNYHNNPYWSLNKNTNSFQKDRVFGNSSIYVKPTSYLTVQGRIGLDYYNSKNNPVTYSGSNETLLDASTASFHGGSFSLNEQSRTELNADLIASFNKQYGKVSVDALAGANYRNMRWASSSLGANELTVPNLFTISNVSGSPVTSMDNSWIRSNSVFGSASIGYDSWIYINATARNDWSSTISESFFYPSVSASFLPLEAFDVESNTISYLKLRGGWAKVGAATSAYRTDPYFGASANTIYGVTQYSQTTTFPPAALRPEQVVTSELGLEMNFLDNRLGFDVAVYDKTTTDQIMSVAISKATGYNSTLINAGEINNKGFELQLNGSVLKSNNGLNWDVIVNFASDKSEIIELYTDPVTGQELESYEIGSQWSTYVQARPGDEWGVIYGTGMLRDGPDGLTGNVIVGESGLPELVGNMKLGSVAPDWTGGIRNEFSYKNWSAGFLIDIRKGGDIFSVSNMFGAYGGQLGFTAEGDIRENGIVLGENYMADENFVKADGSKNDITTSAQTFFKEFYSNRELSVYDGSYGKLREAHITYNLPRNLFGVGDVIKGGNISLVGTNLAILWTHESNKAGLDPENSVGSGNGGVGLETTSIPPSRSFGVKLNLKF